jgi:hypothetical protein
MGRFDRAVSKLKNRIPDLHMLLTASAPHPEYNPRTPVDARVSRTMAMEDKFLTAGNCRRVLIYSTGYCDGWSVWLVDLNSRQSKMERTVTRVSHPPAAAPAAILVVVDGLLIFRLDCPSSEEVIPSMILNIFDVECKSHPVCEICDACETWSLGICTHRSILK